MTGTGVLAVWNNRAAESAANYESWYQGEHLPERLAVPGFVRGRRYEAVEGAPQFFTWYEVDSPAVLRSEAYTKCLANPTPWTQEIMSGIFRDTSRTVCRRQVLSGEVFGSVAVVVRFAGPADDPAIRAALAGMSDPAVLVRSEIWERDADAGDGAMAEEAIRGPDQKIEGCLFLEFLREADGIAAAGRLNGRFAGAEIGVYRLLCERGNTKLR